MSFISNYYYKIFSKWVLKLIIPILIFIIWHLSYTLNWFPPSVSASPINILKVAFRLIFEGDLAWHALLSLIRLLVGSIIGICLGLILGLTAIVNQVIDKVFTPTIQFIAPIPAVVWLPFAVMLFGTGELYKIFLPFLITFLLVYIQTLQGAKNISNNYLEVAQIYEKSKYDIIRKVILPPVLPSVFTGIKVALAIGWIAIFIVEFSSADPNWGGLGWFIADARDVGRVEDQFAGAAVLGVIGYITDWIINIAQHRMLLWSKPFNNEISTNQ